MSDPKPTNEQLYFDTLIRIAKAYLTPAQLRRNADARAGLEFEEALEMAYENIQGEAAAAIRGKKRPAK